MPLRVITMPYLFCCMPKTIEDQEEELIVCEFFSGEPCCTLGPNKSACWSQAGRETFLLARHESQGLDKKSGI